MDECTGPAVAAWLRSEWYDVFSVYEDARGASDDDIIEKAFAENWILITNDRDFGERVYRERKPHHCIIFLRLEDERAVVKIETLQRLLANYGALMPNNFVVTETQVRFARTMGNDE